MSLGDTWRSLGRADRVVYGAAVALVALSFLTYLPGVAVWFVDEPKNHSVWSPIWFRSRFFEHGQEIVIGVAVLCVLGWEAAKAAHRVLTRGSSLVVAALLSVPVAAPLAGLAAWLAHLLEPNLPDHPLLRHALPLPLGVGGTVYVVTTALVIAGLGERRDHERER